MIICDESGVDHEDLLSDSTNADYRTADELYELMTSTNRQVKENEVLTPMDIGLLYQNMEFGTQLINNNLNYQRKKSNQIVETVVHQEDDNSDDGTDGPYVQSKKDNVICHKCGSQKLPGLTDYNKYFKFNDPFIQNYKANKLLDCFKSTSEFDYNFATSLIDNVSCKRLEENFNFDLDNVIVYVNDTLEQLKRISNGDYLTNRAREKWLENTEKDINILTASTSIPLHIERKSTKAIPKWDDIVHSEVDIRSLCKILEKKVVFEVPKIVKSPYKILSQSGEEGLLLQCQKKSLNINVNDTCPRVDVVFQIKRSESGHILSNINSIMILQNTMAPLINVTGSMSVLKYQSSNKELLKIKPTHETYTEANVMDITEKNESTNFEIDKNPVDNLESNDITLEESGVAPLEKNDVATLLKIYDEISDNNNVISATKPDEGTLELENVFTNKDDTTDVPSDSVLSSDWTHYPTTAARSTSGDSMKNLEVENPSDFESEATSDAAPDGLMITIEQLRKQSTVLEEAEEAIKFQESPRKDSHRKRTPVARIKSPYANKSLVIEEKKRRRLLEIREQREKRKIALLQAYKNKKNKLQADGIQPQASTSVTKLSITNKSFYNSIFGKSDVFKKSRKGKKDNKKAVIVENQVKTTECDPVLSLMSFDIKCDDANVPSLVTKPHSDAIVDKQQSNKGEMTDVKRVDLNPFNSSRQMPVKQELKNQKTEADYHTANVVPDNTPRKTDKHEKSNPSQCVKESIGMIYDLMNSFSAQGDTGKYVSTNFGADSESETAIKHCDVMSSCNSFEKCYSEKEKGKSDKRYTPTVPKVVISSKLQHRRITQDKAKVNDSKLPSNNNPLEAISHILHEFENVHKTKKNSEEIKKKLDETKYKYDRFNRRVKQDINTRSLTSAHKVQQKIDVKDGKNKPTTILLSPKADNVNIKSIENQHLKFTDASDEAREARGEAVKGPSRQNTRLNVLAQPKRVYVQAHSEEFQNKYGRNLIADRLHRLASSGLNNQELTTPGRTKIKPKKFGNDVVSSSPSPMSEMEKYLDRKKRFNVRSTTETLPIPPRSRNTNNLSRTLDSRNVKKTIQTIDMNSTSRPHSPIKCSIIKKSRVPFVPNDLELGHPSNISLEGSIEDKLNNIINKITKNDLTDVPEYPERSNSIIFCEGDNMNCDVKDISIFFGNATPDEETSINGEIIESSNYPISRRSTQMSLKHEKDEKKMTQQKHVSFNTDPPKAPICEIPSQPVSKLISNHKVSPLKIKRVTPTFRNVKIVRPHTAPKVEAVQKLMTRIESMKEQALQTNYYDDHLLKLSCSSECCQTDQIQITNVYSNVIEADSDLNLINSIANTNSLDILVKLLNEIQNITTKQTQISKTNENDEFPYNGFNTYEPIMFCKESVSATAIDSRRSSNTHIVGVSKLREFYEPVRNVSRTVNYKIKPLTSNKEILTDSLVNRIDGSCQVLDSKTNNSTETNFLVEKHNKLISIMKNKVNTVCVEDEGKELDDEHMMKIKRDVLVTVYSFLVITVFAALTFPEYYVNTL